MKKFLFILLITFIFALTDLERAKKDPFCKLLNNNTAKILCIKLKDNHKFDQIKDLALNSPEATEEAKKIEGVISSISYVPSIAGILLTSYVINDIIG